MATSFSINILSQPFPSSINNNKNPTYSSNINIKTKTLLCLTLVVLVKDYILQLTVFSLAVKVLARDTIFQLTTFSLARAFKYLKVYISNQFIFLQKKTNCYKDFVNMFFITVKLHLNNCQIFRLKAVLGYRRYNIKIVCQLLDDPELLKYINIIYSPASKQIPTGIFKNKNRPVFTLNEVVDGFYNNSLKCQRSSVLVIQTKINKDKEEIRIVQYLLLKVVIRHILNKAKRNRQSLRYSFTFISYIEGKQYKEVLKAIRGYILIDRIFVLIQICNTYLFLRNRLSLITRYLKVRIEFKALLLN